MSVDRTALATAQIAGRYQIIARIGAGGMGEVYRARDSVLGRTVAVKMLPAELVSRPGAVDRFRAEAQSAARLSHPNVVQVHDWGEHEATYYMVMEYVRGRNLRQVLAAHRQLSPAQSAEIAAQVLAALAASHRGGLIHRDIKPENVIVGIDGTVKVTDFGIARAVEGATSTGELFGTVAYVAPEQVRGGSVDQRADIYSTGCLLYELLTGAPPFEGDTAAVLYRRLHESISPPSMSVPEARHLDRVVLTSTAIEMESRYPSAEQMRSELKEASAAYGPAPDLSELTYEVTDEVKLDSADTIAGKPMPPARKRRRWIAPVAVLFALAIGFAVYFRPSQVPAMIGLQVDEAAAKVSAQDFEVKRSVRFADDPAGTVVGSDPDPGKWLIRGGTVTLVVSAGPPVTDAPDVKNLTLEEAKTKIVESGLTVGKVAYQHDAKAKDTVLAQDPAPGRVRRGDPVNLVVSSGPEIVEVPSVKEKPVAEAEQILRDAGLVPSRTEVFNDAPSGTVMDQSPQPGTKVDKGTSVKLTVSKGPAPFAMPDVKSKTCAEAKSQLESLGLVVVVRSQRSECGSGKVLDQDPLPGATVRKGQEATIYTA